MIFDRDPSTGALAQKPGSDGCIAATDLGLNCALGRTGGGGIAISADGKNVYTAGHSIGIFDRNPVTGNLTQRPDSGGCISEDGSPPGDPAASACADGVAVQAAQNIAVSPDGKNVYSTSSTFGRGAVAIFDRDTAHGGLRQKPGPNGCIAELGDGVTCADGKALDTAGRLPGDAIAVSPDNRSVYVTSSSGGGAIAIFDRNVTSGALAQKPGTAGCVSQTGSPSGTPLVNACIDGKGMGGAANRMGIALSPDAKNLYFTAPVSDAVAIFDRTATGALAQKAGLAGCISKDGSPTGDPPVNFCANGGGAVDGAGTVAVSGDGLSVYVGSADPAAIPWFDRDPATGALSLGGCASDGGSGGICTPAFFPGGTPVDVAVSPDAKNVYVQLSFYGFAIFARERDLNPPETTIVSGPPAGTNTGDSTPTFRFSSSQGGSTFECSVDGSAFRPCVSPFTTGPLTVGRHSFSVRATDSAGNLDPTPASRSFTVTRASALPPPLAPFAGCRSLISNVIRGTAAANTINGTPRADRIFAGNGNDRVNGLGASDCVELGAGSDRGQGGSGNDLLVGGSGSDTISGSTGNDRLLGDAGNDRLTGSSGRDRLAGGSGRDRLSGGSSADRIAGDRGNDRIAGGSSRDVLRGNSGNDRIDARDRARDSINCGTGRDTVVADRIDRVSRNCERIRRR